MRSRSALCARNPRPLCARSPGPVRARRQITVAALLCAATVTSAHAASAAGTCAGLRDLVGPCFPMHGRAAFYNGSPTVRIWKVGTRRLLGVSDSRCQSPECRQMPDGLRARLGWDRPVFGDFVVCPFTRQRRGVMQMVCVESAHRLRSH